MKPRLTVIFSLSEVFGRSSTTLSAIGVFPSAWMVLRW
jgi:hypothetical protein